MSRPGELPMSESMSVTRTKHVAVRYRYNWGFNVQMIPWHRQVISVIYALGVIMIALWALEQGQGRFVVLGVVGMSMLTLMLIFGVEIDTVRVGNLGKIEFTDTRDKPDTASDEDKPTLAEAEEVVKEAEEDE